MSSTAAPRLGILEKLVLVQVAGLVLVSSWIFGGNIWWIQWPLIGFSSAGIAITLVAFCQSGVRGTEARRKAWWLMPLGLFGTLVIISTLNPSFRTVTIDGETAYVRSTTAHPFLPSSVAPSLSLTALWFSAGAYLSAFNLAVVVKSRTALRRLLVLIAANTLVLSVMGTLQKLAGTGFYFGASNSPSPRYFATFIYNNHWGAFLIMGLATAIGVLFYQARRWRARDIWHSPMPAALLGVVLIAASAPVSASRACTLLTAMLMTGALVHAAILVTAKRRAVGLSPLPPLFFMLVFALATTSAVGWLSYRSLTQRFTETRLAMDQGKSVFGGRAELYRDTWELAGEKPLFGWGLNTYAVSFQLIRPFTVNLRDQDQNAYATAHSDWLQSLAETGFAGTGLLVLMGLFPLMSLPRRCWPHPLFLYPAAGCAIVLLYAWIEFPFSNRAVLITFWSLFFMILRHAQLTDEQSRNHHA